MVVYIYCVREFKGVKSGVVVFVCTTNGRDVNTD